MITRLTNYDPMIKSNLLERVFDVKPSTINFWEESNIINPERIETSKKRPQKVFGINDIINVYRKKGQNFANRTRIVAVWNNKGGVGKSTVVQHLSSTLSTLFGLRTLIIDADSQADLTMLMQAEQQFDDIVEEDVSFQPTFREIIGWEDMDGALHRVPSREAIKRLSPTLSIIPSDADLSDLYYDLNLPREPEYDEDGIDISRLNNVSKAVEPLNQDYDIIIFDCAPNIGLFNMNILWAADFLLCPVELEAKSIHTVLRNAQRLETFSRLHSGFNFEDILLVPNKFRDDTIKSKAYLKLKEHFPEILSSAKIPQTTAIDKCADDKEPVFIHSTRSKGTYKATASMAKRLANEFWKLSHEVIGITAERALYQEEL